MRKNIKRFLWLLAIILLLFVIQYLYKALPIISGYNAKVACSCMFNSNRTLGDVQANELSGLPFSMATIDVDSSRSTVAASVWGMAAAKAVYRKGLGCTLVHPKDSEPQLVPGFTPLQPTINADITEWPLGNAHAYQTFNNIDMTALNNALSYVFSTNKKGKTRFGTRAVVVLYKGKIVKEAYAPGFTSATPQAGWSMTKSIGNALTGILVKKSKLRLNEDHLFKEWNNDERQHITIDNLLNANSGLEWREVYTSPSPATNMLFVQNNSAGYALQFPQEDVPGTVFRYSSGTSNILSYKIRQVTSDGYGSFTQQQLFAKTGMFSAVIEPDASGTFVNSSFCFASARDWARFGLLYLNDGVVNGNRILPEGWVAYTRTPASGAAEGEYGAQFWLNAGAPGNSNLRTYPSVPTDCFYADGYEGQFIWIIPSKELVVVKLALQNDEKLDEDKFLALVMRSIK